jgi:hypothetical protein
MMHPDCTAMLVATTYPELAAPGSSGATDF